MVGILRRALILRWDDKVYWEISRDLMRYSVINVLMPRQQRAHHLVGYYEMIKNLDGCAQNPFFWLQYTIARLSLREYAHAEINLQTAYAQASRMRDFDTYQIDNTKARFLLERCIGGLNRGGALADFREANRILRIQISERRHGVLSFSSGCSLRSVLGAFSTFVGGESSPQFFLCMPVDLRDGSGIGSELGGASGRPQLSRDNGAHPCQCRQCQGG
jgi:hypothetical protein